MAQSEITNKPQRARAECRREFSPTPINLRVVNT